MSSFTPTTPPDQCRAHPPDNEDRLSSFLMTRPKTIYDHRNNTSSGFSPVSVEDPDGNGNTGTHASDPEILNTDASGVPRSAISSLCNDSSDHILTNTTVVEGADDRDSGPADEWLPLQDSYQPEGGKHSVPSVNDGQSIWQIWKFEILSNFVALGCIVAIISILAIHQGQPLPDWPDLISINSLIAILTAVFKASLILPVAEGEFNITKRHTCSFD